LILFRDPFFKGRRLAWVIRNQIGPSEVMDRFRKVPRGRNLPAKGALT
jgi:hypothetical protein